MPAHARRSRSWFLRHGPRRVPEVTAMFWVIKAFSTAMGEATSDFMVHTIAPVIAVVLGFVAFGVALGVQFAQARYRAWSYWFAVAMVGVFGTMAADVLHVGLAVPYDESTALYAVVLATVFIVWWFTEGTLSIHSIDTARREVFYWLAVCSTFAMGTALGDLTATTFKLGYLPSAVLFACLIGVPALGYRFLGWGAVASFWTAYVLTRPLGASVADGLGKPRSVSGLGWGDGWVALGFAVLIVVSVGYLVVSKSDVQRQVIEDSRRAPLEPREPGIA